MVRAFPIRTNYQEAQEIDIYTKSHNIDAKLSQIILTLLTNKPRKQGVTK